MRREAFSMITSGSDVLDALSPVSTIVGSIRSTTASYGGLPNAESCSSIRAACTDRCGAQAASPRPSKVAQMVW